MLERRSPPTAEKTAKRSWRAMPRHRRRWIMGLGLAVLVGLIATWWWRRPDQPRYVTAPVTRGPIVHAVIATGTVNPVITVQVGTYVSGTIQALYCDYNTQVHANQLCAKIDPRPYQVIVEQDAATLASARAQLKKDQASLAYAKITYQRDLGLLKAGVTSQEEVDNDKSLYEQAKAQVALDLAAVAQHEAELRAAKVNLGYTNIISPVVGTVVSRNIDVGQTVAASFQTPTLFLVAKDLTRMQVDANVSESDVGTVRVGQQGTFTVEAYPNRTFEGRVVQIRRAPITVQNVVTYDVVIGVNNPDLTLFPGMTANTRVITAERDAVLRVPLQAFRYTPQAPSRSKRPSDTASSSGVSPNPSPAQASNGPTPTQVWVLRDGQPVPIPVVRGMDDGTLAEVTSTVLTAGDQVIVNEVSATDSSGKPRQSLTTQVRF